MVESQDKVAPSLSPGSLFTTLSKPHQNTAFLNSDLSHLLTVSLCLLKCQLSKVSSLSVLITAEFLMSNEEPDTCIRHLLHLSIVNYLLI